jgi:hypothetical protein
VKPTLHVSLPQSVAVPSVAPPNKVFTREFRAIYTCTATAQGILVTPKKWERRDPYYITRGEHTHTIQFTSVIDWSGTPDEVVIDYWSDGTDVRETAWVPLDKLLAEMDTSNPAASDSQIMYFMLATQRIVQTRLLADSRVAPYLRQLGIHIQNLTTRTTYTESDQDNVDSHFVPACEELSDSRIASGAAEGILILLHDLLADIAFGDALERKRIELSFPALPQPFQSA